MVENMIEILLDVSLSLDPDLNFCLNAGLKQQSERLEYLLSVKKNFNDFLSHLDRLLLDNTHGKYLPKSILLNFRSRTLILFSFSSLLSRFEMPNKDEGIIQTLVFSVQNSFVKV